MCRELPRLMPLPPQPTRQKRIGKPSMIHVALPKDSPKEQESVDGQGVCVCGP
jgi:hypothetical protein